VVVSEKVLERALQRIANHQTRPSRIGRGLVLVEDVQDLQRIARVALAELKKLKSCPHKEAS
jgi:hypothetical protein